MAKISSYPLKAPKLGDLLIFAETYDASKANPVIGNPTKTATISSVNALAVNGTIDTVPLFTSSNSIGDSIITQNTALEEIFIDGKLTLTNSDEFRIIRLNSSSTGFGGNYIQAFKSDGTPQWTFGSQSGFDDRVTLSQQQVGDIRIQNTSGDVITALSTGNVGIRNTSPQRELDVNGGVRVRGPLDLFQSNDNTFAGQDAGNWYNINSSKNTAFGKNSQAVQLSGSQNTSVGYNSMAEAASGNLNTAVGDSAMSLNNGGSFNTAVGAGALKDQEAGQGNTAIGYDSLNNKEESNFNTALGYKSLFNISTGFKNIGIGDSVGLTLSTGNKNVLIGSVANVAASSDTNSIVIGADVTGAGTNTATIGNASTTALHVGGNNAGIVLKSPNGTAYKLTIANGGNVVVTAV